MPELPEVETVRGGLENHLMGRRIEQVELRRPDLRFPFPSRFASRLRGRLVERIDRRAKYLLIRLSGNLTWMCHLGMTGRWTLLGADAQSDDGKHDWVVIYLENGGSAVFSDSRRFGFMDLFETAEQDQNRFLAKLGPEPTPDYLTPMNLAENLRGRRTSMKAALLDQRTVAGLGNIYVCEVLHRAGISPRRTAASVAGKSGGVSKRVERITAATHDVIVEAIDAGGSSISDFVNVDGELGYFSHQFLVYDRENEPCLSDGCETTIRRIVQSGRSTFYCPACQQ